MIFPFSSRMSLACARLGQNQVTVKYPWHGPLHVWTPRKARISAWFDTGGHPHPVRHPCVLPLVPAAASNVGCGLPVLMCVFRIAVRVWCLKEQWPVPPTLCWWVVRWWSGLLGWSKIGLATSKFSEGTPFVASSHDRMGLLFGNVSGF